MSKKENLKLIEEAMNILIKVRKDENNKFSLGNTYLGLRITIEELNRLIRAEKSEDREIRLILENGKEEIVKFSGTSKEAQTRYLAKLFGENGEQSKVIEIKFVFKATNDYTSEVALLNYLEFSLGEGPDEAIKRLAKIPEIRDQDLFKFSLYEMLEDYEKQF